MNKDNFNPNCLGNNNDSSQDGSLNFLSTLNKIVSNKNTSEDNLKLKITELEKINDYLKNMNEIQAKEIVEIELKNNKSISIIAHDLRSPFNTIMGSLQVLKRNLKHNDNNENEKFIAMATDSATKTLNLLDVLLEWSLTRNTEKKIIPVTINLYELITDEIENEYTAAKQKQIKLNQQISSNLLVNADLQMVKTIFRNLIGNAIKYSKKGDEIKISAKVVSQFAEISIKDNGIGISKKAQKDLFKIDEFKSTCGTNNELGTGLGLVLCNEFVGQLGGKIWVKSDTGKGSEFIFTLPIYSEN